MCVLKFKNYWLKKLDSRKVNSPFRRARASCKFEFITSPIPLAEMISSDHSTAEISHFLNKWFSSVKLFTHDLKVKKVDIDFSWADAQYLLSV